MVRGSSRVNLTPLRTGGTDPANSNEDTPEDFMSSDSPPTRDQVLSEATELCARLLSSASTQMQHSDIVLSSPPTTFHIQAKVRVKKQKKGIFAQFAKKKQTESSALEELKHPLEAKLTSQLLKFAIKYRPETRTQKIQRRADAAARAKNNMVQESEKPYVLKFGVNHIAALSEARKAKLVVIAMDATPPEVAVWVPNLCRKRKVPYAFIDRQARLGTLVNKKRAVAIAFTDIRPADMDEFNSLVSAIRAHQKEKTNAEIKFRNVSHYSHLLMRSLMSLPVEKHL